MSSELQSRYLTRAGGAGGLSGACHDCWQGEGLWDCNNQQPGYQEREDLRRAWDCTVVGWEVNGKYVSRDEAKEGWRRIEEWNNGEGKSLDILDLNLNLNLNFI